MPDRRPNRAHGAIDQLPPEIQLQIRDWYLGRPEEDIPRLTYDQIADELVNAGYQIGKSQVHRWIAKQRNELERIQTVMEKAQALKKYFALDNADVEQSAVSLAIGLFFEALADADIQQVKSVEDLVKVANSLGRLQTSSVARDKWEQEKRKKIDLAIRELEERVRGELEADSPLAEQLVAYIHQAGEKMMEKTA